MNRQIRQVRRICSLLCCFALLWSCLPPVGPAGTAQAATAMWVDLGGNMASEEIDFLPDVSLVIDSGGTPYLAHLNNQMRPVVKKFNGVGWESLGELSTAEFSVFLKLTLDSDDNPVVVFLEAEAGIAQLKVMRFDGGGWEHVGLAGSLPSWSVMYVDIAAGDDGHLYIAYGDADHGENVYVMYYNGTSWSAVGGAISSGGGYHPKIVVDGSGTPYVAYNERVSNWSPKVARYNGAAWELVGGAAVSSGPTLVTSIVLDEEGMPYVAYEYGDQSGNGFVKRYDGTSWQPVGGAIASEAVEDIELAFDDGGAVYGIYKTKLPLQQLNVKKWEDDSWESVGPSPLAWTPNREGDNLTGYSMDIVFHGNDPYIAFVDAVERKVRVMTWADTYTMAYDGNGQTSGNAPTDDNVYMVGQNVEILPNAGAQPLVRTGHVFGGWNTSSDGTGTDYSSATGPLTMGSSDVTLYAKWVANIYDVIFDSNGGSDVAALSLAYGSVANEPTPPVRDGYEFADWHADEALSAAFSFATPIAEHTTLYAKWLLNAPGEVLAVPGNGEAALSWSTVTSATYYHIFQRIESGVYGIEPAAKVPSVGHGGAAVTEMTYTMSGLTNGTTYYFAVAAIDGAGTESALSAEAGATPQSPDVPTLAAVRLTSSNPAPQWARSGDTVEIAFTASASLGDLPIATIRGQAALVESLGDDRYRAAYTFAGHEPEGIIGFTIDFTSDEGVSGVQATTTTDGSSVTFDNTPPTGSLAVNGGAAATASRAVTLTIAGADGAGSGVERMRLSNDETDWSDWEAISGRKAWTLASGFGQKTVYMELADAAGNVSAAAATASIRLTSSGGGDGGGAAEPGDEGAGYEVIVVDVENGVGAAVARAEVRRITDLEGRKRDEVVISRAEVELTLAQSEEAQTPRFRLSIPDEAGQADELLITIAAAAVGQLAEIGASLELDTRYGRIEVPGASFEGASDDYYFRIIPVKENEQLEDIQLRLGLDSMVREMAGDGVVRLAGTPVKIETNMQHRSVSLTLPLGGANVDSDDQRGIAMFIEHSNGERQLLRGEYVAYDETGQPGLRVIVTHFSLFSLIHVEHRDEPSVLHSAYMNGFTDGLFRPDQPITAAHLAAIWSRVVGGADMPELLTRESDGAAQLNRSVTRAELVDAIVRLLAPEGIASATPTEGGRFTDIGGHWAEQQIEVAKAAKIIDGYADGAFRPDAATTRAEAVAMINRLLGREPLRGQQQRWPDVPVSHWAFGHIEAASVDHEPRR